MRSTFGPLVGPGNEKKARAWLTAQRDELEVFPSGLHTTQLPDAFRIGLSGQSTWTFLERLRIQLYETSETDRWPVVVQASTNAIEAAITHMLVTAREACQQSGREVTTVAKTKDFRFESDAAFYGFVNRWKSDDDDANFQRLLMLVRGAVEQGLDALPSSARPQR